MSGRLFCLPGDGGYVSFEESVLVHMYQYAQMRWFHREAGGQLFSPTPQDAAVVITHATGPYLSDIRRRNAFVPDPKQATADRHRHFAEHRHAVGLWHTHPEPDPTPSGQDRTTAQEYLHSFNGAMTGFLLVILGNCGTPLNMAVWLAQGDRHHSWSRLQEV
jgi:integrative and conjugative element protein (TIGR02256 family)